MNRSTARATVAVALSTFALVAAAPVFAAPAGGMLGHLQPMSGRTVERVALQHGFVLHRYADGLMAVENPFGRPVRVDAGQVLTTADGGTVTMVGDEVARLAQEQRARDHR